MEEKVMVRSAGVEKSKSLHDCIETAYRLFKGHRAELIWTLRIGYIDGDELFVEDKYLNRCAVKDIIKSGTGS